MPAKKRGLATPASSKTPAAASATASQSSAPNGASPEPPAQKRRRSARVQQKQDLENPIQQSKAGAPPSRAVSSSSKTPSTSRSADPKPATHPKASKKQAKEAVTATEATTTTTTTAVEQAAHPSPVTGATAQTDVHVQLPVPSLGDSASTSDSPPSSGFTPSYWLLKAEPESRIEKGKDVKFSIDDLAACKEPAGWDGVRNYAARNNLRAMKAGDLAFFYHSNCKEPGIAGIMEIAEGASIDETAFNPKEPYFDPKSDRSNPKWYLVKVRFVRKFTRLVSLHELKSHGGPGGKLANMALIKMSRLSVSPVGRAEWDFILDLERKSQ
ncbi:PUA-like domain-containing protein [Tirmania nivea]|nr:PUA-like domain-containing protein [Tirmania nivea]